jgi:hypothetical protein
MIQGETILTMISAKVLPRQILFPPKNGEKLD